MTIELIERLRTCPERGRTTIEAADTIEAQAKYIRELEDANTDELVTLRKDAARYRWLRRTQVELSLPNDTVAGLMRCVGDLDGAIAEQKGTV